MIQEFSIPNKSNLFLTAKYAEIKNSKKILFIIASKGVPIIFVVNLFLLGLLCVLSVSTVQFSLRFSFFILSTAVRVIQRLLCSVVIFLSDASVKADELIKDKTVFFTQMSNFSYSIKG